MCDDDPQKPRRRRRARPAAWREPTPRIADPSWEARGRRLLAHLRHRPFPATTGDLVERARRLGESIDPIATLAWLEFHGQVSLIEGRWHVLRHARPAAASHPRG